MFERVKKYTLFGVKEMFSTSKKTKCFCMLTRQKFRVFFFNSARKVFAHVFSGFWVPVLGPGFTLIPDSRERKEDFHVFLRQLRTDWLARKHKHIKGKGKKKVELSQVRWPTKVTPLPIFFILFQIYFLFITEWKKSVLF